MGTIQLVSPERIKQASALSAVLEPRFIFRRYVLVALTRGAIIAIGLDLGSNTRGFKDGPANSFPFQIAALAQGMASILKLAALCDGELGAGEQDIGHAAILPDRRAVAIKQVNPASSVVSGMAMNDRPPPLATRSRRGTNFRVLVPVGKQAPSVEAAE